MNAQKHDRNSSVIELLEYKLVQVLIKDLSNLNKDCSLFFVTCSLFLRQQRKGNVMKS